LDLRPAQPDQLFGRNNPFMKSLAPIPTPLSARWREFRTRILPVIVCVGVVTAIVFLWQNHTGPATMQGIGEGVRSVVSAPQTVRIQEWLVAPYEIVPAGTPLVVVVPADPRADFDLLRSLHEMARVRSQPSLAQDNAMNFERIRVELLKTKSELAIARVKLEQAERDVARNTPLLREKLVAQDIYELSVNTRDALKAEVDEKAKATTLIEQRLEQLRAIGEPDVVRDEIGKRTWLAQLEQAQARASKNLESQTLVAPIAGMVGLAQRQAGEFVAVGEPLVTINSLRADNVVAYLRQPYRFDPQVGMTARVTTRTYQRQAFLSQIIQVGAQVEILTNALTMLRPGSLVDAALPIVVAVPAGIHIRPGEVVDVVITEPSVESSAPAAQATPARPQL
jgi:multidrug resistance efflux pump